MCSALQAHGEHWTRTWSSASLTQIELHRVGCHAPFFTFCLSVQAEISRRDFFSWELNIAELNARLSAERVH